MFQFCLYSNDLTISSKSFAGPKFNSSSVKNPFIFARHGAFNKKKKKVTLWHQIEPWIHRKTPKLKKIQSVFSLSNKLLFLHHSRGWHFTIFHNVSTPVSVLYHPGSMQYSIYLQFIILKKSFPVKTLHQKSLCTLIRSIHISDTRDCSSVKI